MIRTTSIITIILAFQLSCQETKPTEQKPEETLVSDSIKKLEAPEVQETSDSDNLPLVFGDLKEFEISTLADTVEVFDVTENVVVSVGISTKQIEAQKEIYGEDDFYTVADDNIYYNYMFEELLDSVGVKIVHSEYRFLKFIGAYGSTIIDLEKEGTDGLFWSYIICNQVEPPQLIQNIIIEDASEILAYLESGEIPTIFNKSPELWSFALNKSDSILKQYDSTIPDSIVSEFLVQYVSVIRQLNEILYDHPDYKTYNSLIWADTSLHDPIAKKFEVKVNQYGYRIDMTEGSIFIERNTDLIGNRFEDYFSEDMTAFWKMYSKENNIRVAEDGGIIVPISELADRMIYWENFNNTHENFVLKSYSSNSEKWYKYFFFHGMDNTPAFGFGENTELDTNFKEAYEYVLKKYPDSDLAVHVKAYMEILDENSYLKTDNVKTYLSRYSL